MSELYRLGLDLGTHSIGWAVWKLKDSAPVEVCDAGVRVFTDSRKPAKEKGALGDPLAVNRRDARSMRRRRDRLIQRKQNLVNALLRQGLWPIDKEERRAFSKWDPYTLRLKALSEELSPEELGRVLLHICQRRGFKSNRKVQSKDDEKGINKGRIAALNKELKTSGFATIGEFQNSRKRLGVRYRKDADFYPDRSHYEEEFRQIREKQSEYFRKIDWNRLHSIIFYQRPLKSQPKGKCRYYTDQERAHKSLPSSHRFRILQELANLRMIGSHGETISLSVEERDILYKVLDQQKTMKFNSLRSKLGVEYKFNLESGKRAKLEGNSTSADMRRPDMFGSLWDELDEVSQDNIVEAMMEAEQDDDILKFLEDFELSKEQKSNINTTTFSKGIGRFSAVLQRECNSVMMRDFVDYSKALSKLGFDHRIPEGRGELDRLPYYGQAIQESCIVRHDPNQNDEEKKFGKIGNPSVHVAMNQLRRVVNSLIEKHGKPDEIVVELARDLKLGRKKRDEIIKDQTKRQEDNEKLDGELKTTHRLVSPTGKDRQKLRLYKELQQDNISAKCPYCGKTISAEELFGSNIEEEHILPFSRTLDDGRNNKTISHWKCNRQKREQSPYEAFGESPAGYNWTEIQERIQTLPKAKKWRFQQDAMEQFSDTAGFLQRQLTDNAYIARVARRYLTTICPANKVWGTTGRMTAVLRRKWNMNSILSKDAGVKNRSDHRHHAVDAAVIALVDRSLLKKIAVANRLGNGDLERFTFKIPNFPGGEEGRNRLFEVIKRIFPSFKPEHGLQGRLFKQTAYGEIKKALLLPTAELKEDLVDLILPSTRRQEVRELIARQGFARARKALQKQYPTITLLKSLWVTRKPFTELERSDLNQPTYGGNTRGPSDFKMRTVIQEYLNRYPEEKPKKVLQWFAEEHGIRHVRYIPAQQKITRIASSPEKGYELDDYAYVDIWMLPAAEGKKPRYEGDFVSRWEANQTGQARSSCRHPGARKLMRLFKNDTISLLDEGLWKHYRVAGYATTQNRLDIQPIWRADSDWFDTLNHRCVPAEYPRTLRKNYKSINSLWQKHRVRKLYVGFTGDVR